MAEQSTEERSVTVKGPKPDAKLVFQKLKATETLNKGFDIRLEVMSDQKDLDFKDFGGQKLSVTFTNKQGNGRSFCGYVVSMSRVTGVLGESAESMYTYRFRLAPWTRFLAMRQDCRIFNSNDGKVDNSVKDILKKVFADAGFSSDYSQGSLTESYTSLNYVVQFNESDLDFARRMMEREGIYHYFEHTADSSKLILADGPSGHSEVSGYETIPYRDESEPSAVDSVRGWNRWHAVRSGALVSQDYDPTDPAKNLKKESKDKGDYDQAEHEVYEFPGRYVDPAAGERYVKSRMAQLASRGDYIQGHGNAVGITAGYNFELKDHYNDSENIKCTVISTQIAAEADKDNWDPGTGDARCKKYKVNFRAIPATVRYQPPRVTPQPRAVGPHTAVVVGQNNEEITTDEHGRIKVQFHWDRNGKFDQDSSCWVRVIQSWSHGKWGSQFIPRHGMEVIVEYIDGDLEKPIVTGCVYNGKNKSPFALPDEATQSGVVSRSTKKGTQDNANMIVLEDKKDEELLFIQAERDAERIVKNNDTQTIGTEYKDPGDQTITIHNDRTVTLKEGNDTLTVETGEQTIDVKKKITIKAGDEIHLETGQATLTMKKDGTITVKGKDITIQGSGSIVEKASKDIEIKATANAKLQGNGNVDVKAGGNLTAKGSVGTFDGGGACTVKGGVVKIN
ncbi:MAG: type VI secretion system Vgr family protein [Phycisphaerales bacterium JB040]